jgi:hypothetical protein
VQILFHFRTIHFTFLDRINQRSIGFQSGVPETTQDDKCLCASRWFTKLYPTSNKCPRSTQGVYFQSHAQSANQRIQISQELPIDVPNHILYFYMHIITYKKQGTPDQHSIQLLLLSTCTSPRTKVRGSQSTLPINVSNQLLYFVHAHRHVQKARDSRSMLHTASTTFNMHITAYKK